MFSNIIDVLGDPVSHILGVVFLKEKITTEVGWGEGRGEGKKTSSPLKISTSVEDRGGGERGEE